MIFQRCKKSHCLHLLCARHVGVVTAHSRPIRALPMQYCAGLLKSENTEDALSTEPVLLHALILLTSMSFTPPALFSSHNILSYPTLLTSVLSHDSLVNQILISRLEVETWSNLFLVVRNRP